MFNYIEEEVQVSFAEALPMNEECTGVTFAIPCQNIAILHI